MLGKYKYGEMTWPEVAQAAKENRLALVPVATIEDHGPHLPVDTDVLLCTEVCSQAAARVTDQVVLVPPILHGYSPHHLDFPGPITIGAQTFIQYVLDVGKSLAHHGFRRILLVNGHGSNAALVEAAARLTTIETQGEAICVGASYWNLGPLREVAARILTSGEVLPGHAGEFETSLSLAIRPALVDMSKAVREFPQPGYRVSNPPDTVVAMMPYWSAMTKSGIVGDATLGTGEKGQALLEAAVSGLVELVKELRAREYGPRVDHH